jgi:hypothetical protein
VADHLRRVIREYRFERELQALIADAADADRFVEGAEFLLVRDPEIGFSLNLDRTSGFCQWLQSTANKFRCITRSTKRRYGCSQSHE